MQLLLDSANFEEARTCAEWGWVSGITTNPTILAKSGKSTEKTLVKLKKIISGPIFYQLTQETIEEMVKEAKLAADILNKQLVLKIPATEVGFQATAILSKKYTCAVTSIFSPAQALVAHAAGAKYALYYHNRAKRLMKNGKHLAGELVLALKRTDTTVIAASLKSPDELVQARNAGVPILTTTFEILKQMMRHDLSDKAVADFILTGTGLLDK